MLKSAENISADWGVNFVQIGWNRKKPKFGWQRKKFKFNLGKSLLIMGS